MSDPNVDKQPSPKRKRGLYGQHPSASGDAARRLDFEETWAMTARERALLALQLGQRGKYLEGLLKSGAANRSAR